MKRMIARAATAGALATAVIAGVATPAMASSWHYVGTYDNGTACQYSGENYMRVQGWADFECLPIAGTYSYHLWGLY